jgi:plastocyanin
MGLRFITVLAVLALALAGAGTAAAAQPSAASSHKVVVTAKDYSFALSTKTVAHGMVTFVIKNDGHATHDFVIAGHASKTIDPGKTTRLTVELKPGRHPYKCSVDSHAEMGMKGVLRAT